MIFGYDDFNALVHDENFNKERLSQVLYIYYDPKEFASSLETIAQHEETDNDDLGPYLLFDM